MSTLICSASFVHGRVEIHPFFIVSEITPNLPNASDFSASVLSFGGYMQMKCIPMHAQSNHVFDPSRQMS